MASSPHLSTLLEARCNRRDLLRSAFAAGVGIAITSSLPARGLAAMLDEQVSPLAFTEVDRLMDTQHHLPEGYEAQVLLSWGDPITENAPEFDAAHQSAEAQASQFGFNNDFTAFFPLPAGDQSGTHGLLCVNHEYASAELMFPKLTQKNAVEQASAEQVDILMQSVGCSVVEIALIENRWKVMRRSVYNRRVTATTPIAISGPASGVDRLKTSEDSSGKTVLGTFGNCGGGVTPWGTYLSCEENIDDYFRFAAGTPEEAAHKRMGVGKDLYNGWYRSQDRFDVGKEPTEINRFGWVVEIDPYEPSAPPVKRTALGRFKHESASCVLNPDGRITVYSGDDESNEYLYRFVTSRPFNPSDRAANKDLLDDGVLSVARFNEDGSMEWLPLVYGQNGLDDKNGFYAQSDVLIDARRAADVAGATPMDRPEDVEVNPQSGLVYVVLTKNKIRTQATAANRRAPNLYGHILELAAPLNRGARDHTATRYEWDLFLAAGNPRDESQGAHYPHTPSRKGWLANPDNIAFDPLGRIWIATDGDKEVTDGANGLFAAQTQGPKRGQTRCFFRAPMGAEVAGPMFDPTGKTLFLSVQHPAMNSTFDAPSTRWPFRLPDQPPRPSVLAITKEDGGPIGG